MCGETCRCSGCKADHEAVLPETAEIAVAAELLDTVNDADLDHVLSGIIGAAARQAGGRLAPETAQLLRAIVKRALRWVLPQAGRIPTLTRGRGTPSVRAAAGRLFGIELEGLSPEDMELASTRRAIRFARSAAQRASRASRRLPPRLVATRSALGAARRWAPGLLPVSSARPALTVRAPPLPESDGRPGKWVRHGDNILVFC